MTIRAIVVDDEPLARERVRSLLEDESDVDIVAECANGRDAIRAIEADPPDLLFLDIQMPEVDGFDVLRATLGHRAPVVIFVTAYDEFAVRAFENHAFDYLLKPFDDDRFAASLDRARLLIRHRRGSDVERRLLGMLRQVATEENSFLQRIAANTGGRIVLIRTPDIDWIEASRNYVRLHVGRETHTIRDNLIHLEAVLDPAVFCRIHRSAIVNIDRIQGIEPLPSGDYVVVLADGTRLNTGRSYRGNVHDLIGE